jgi:glycosyltransferase involved in cell wall biosynthesis
MNVKNNIAIAGTHGVPAKYGGFETLAENLVNELSDEYNFTVYCNGSIYSKHNRNNINPKLKLIYLPFNASGWQSYIYDFVSLIHAFIFHKNIIYLGPIFGFMTFLNLFFKRNLVTNYGGLNEWERPKYNWFQQWLFKINISIATKFSNFNVVDNFELKKSIESKFDCKATIIRYGGDHCEVNESCNDELAKKYSFTKEKYYLSVARAQVDTNLHLLINTFKDGLDFPLVIVSNWNVSEYGRDLKSSFKENKNVILLDAIYDSTELNFIRKNCHLYIHSHSYCGTAPSLVEAICLKLPIICFDVPTNRETTLNKALYFSDQQSLTNIINNLNQKRINNLKLELKLLIDKNYTWNKISNDYKKLLT